MNTSDHSLDLVMVGHGVDNSMFARALGCPLDLVTVSHVVDRERGIGQIIHECTFRLSPDFWPWAILAVVLAMAAAAFPGGLFALLAVSAALTSVMAMIIPDLTSRAEASLFGSLAIFTLLFLGHHRALLPRMADGVRAAIGGK